MIRFWKKNSKIFQGLVKAAAVTEMATIKEKIVVLSIKSHDLSIVQGLQSTGILFRFISVMFYHVTLALTFLASYINLEQQTLITAAHNSRVFSIF